MGITKQAVLKTAFYVRPIPRDLKITIYYFLYWQTAGFPTYGSSHKSSLPNFSVTKATIVTLTLLCSPNTVTRSHRIHTCFPFNLSAMINSYNGSQSLRHRSSIKFWIFLSKMGDVYKTTNLIISQIRRFSSLFCNNYHFILKIFRYKTSDCWCFYDKWH